MAEVRQHHQRGNQSEKQSHAGDNDPHHDAPSFGPFGVRRGSPLWHFLFFVRRDRVGKENGKAAILAALQKAAQPSVPVGPGRPGRDPSRTPSACPATNGRPVSFATSQRHQSYVPPTPTLPPT